jgi:hypothetical protein
VCITVAAPGSYVIRNTRHVLPGSVNCYLPFWQPIAATSVVTGQQKLDGAVPILLNQRGTSSASRHPNTRYTTTPVLTATRSHLPYLCMSLYFPVCVSILTPTHLLIYQYFYAHHSYLLVALCLHVSTCLVTYLSVYLFIYESGELSQFTNWTFEVQFPVGTGIFLSIVTSIRNITSTPRTSQCIVVVPSPGVKRPKRESNYRGG